MQQIVKDCNRRMKDMGQEKNCCGVDGYCNGLEISTAHQNIDADYEPNECSCACHITPCYYECGKEAEGEWEDKSICGPCFTGFTGHEMQGPMRYDYEY